MKIIIKSVESGWETERVVELPEDEGVVDEMRYTFALLPKEDFWADRANYKN